MMNSFLAKGNNAHEHDPVGLVFFNDLAGTQVKVFPRNAHSVWALVDVDAVQAAL
jgi:hypothetical protein